MVYIISIGTFYCLKIRLVTSRYCSEGGKTQNTFGKMTTDKMDPKQGTMPTKDRKFEKDN